MERWAANTLRTLGIILTAGFTLVASLILLLGAMCAGMGGNGRSDQWGPFVLGTVVVMAFGVTVSGWLGRGIVRSSMSTTAGDLATAGVPYGASAPDSSAPTPAAPARAQVSVPMHLSPLGRKAVDRVMYAMAAQIVLSAASWFWSQLQFWTAPRGLAPHNWTLILLGPFILYHLPYGILIYHLAKKVDRRTFAYSLAVPSVLVLQALGGLSVVSYFYIRHPAGFLLVFVPWAIHIVILVLAYKAILQVGFHPEPSSLLVAALATFLYFSFIHGVTPLLYRMGWR